MCLFNLGFVVFSVCLSVVCYSTNEMEIEREREREWERGEGKRENITRNIFCGSRWVSMTTAYMLAPAGFRGRSDGARGGSAGSNCSNLFHRRVGWTRQNPPRPVGNPPQLGSNMRLPIFRPLRGWIWKSCFYKSFSPCNVLPCTFWKLKKVNF